MKTYGNNGATAGSPHERETHAGLRESPHTPDGIVALLKHAMDADKGRRWLADGRMPGGLETFNLRRLIGFGDDERGRWTAYALAETNALATYRTPGKIDDALARIAVTRTTTRRTLPAGAVRLQMDLASDAGPVRYAATAIGEPGSTEVVRVDLYEAKPTPAGRRTRHVDSTTRRQRPWPRSRGRRWRGRRKTTATAGDTGELVSRRGTAMNGLDGIETFRSAARQAEALARAPSAKPALVAHAERAAGRIDLS